MDAIQTVWFAVLFGAVLVWFVLTGHLFRLLREDHCEVYESLGSPSLFLNNSIKNNWLGLRFLVTGRYRELGDARVTRLCSFMRAFLVLYVIWFVGPVAWELLSR